MQTPTSVDICGMQDIFPFVPYPRSNNGETSSRKNSTWKPEEEEKERGGEEPVKMGDRSARKHFKFLFTACFCFVSLSLGSLLLALGRHATQTIRSNRRRPFSLAVTGEKEHTPPLKLACDGICASAESGAAPVPSIHKRARNEQQQEVRSSGKHHDTTTTTYILAGGK